MYNEYLNFAKEIAYYAGKLMKDNFNKSYDIEFKEDRTPVTTIDKQINEYLIERVKNKYPEYSVEGEEARKEGNNYVWVCDPIDGTSMFTRGIPISVFSLALVIDGDVKLGVVYDPFLDNMYTAIKGKGAYCNGEKIHVSNKKFGEIGSSIDYCMWDKAKYDTLEIAKKLRKNFKLCQVGSTAHASMLVATGKISAEIFPGVEHSHCDMAASKVIVEEAGGKVTNFKGEIQRYDKAIDGCVLTNGIIHDELIELIKETYKEELCQDQKYISHLK